MSNNALEREGFLILEGEVNQSSVSTLVRRILAHNLDRDRDVIRLYINSPGGNVDQGFALLDIMAWSRIPIHTTGIGVVASMALLILMAGHRGHRTLMPNCSVLSHRFSTQSQGNHADLLANRIREDLIYDRILAHYSTHSALPDRDSLERELLRSTDRWLTPNEAVAFGMADRVWDKNI